MFVFREKVLNTSRTVVAHREIGWTFGSVILLIGVGVFLPVFADGLLAILYLFLPTTYCYYFIWGSDSGRYLDLGVNKFSLFLLSSILLYQWPWFPKHTSESTMLCPYLPYSFEVESAIQWNSIRRCHNKRIPTIVVRHIAAPPQQHISNTLPLMLWYHWYRIKS